MSKRLKGTEVKKKCIFQTLPVHKLDVQHKKNWWALTTKKNDDILRRGKWKWFQIQLFFFIGKIRNKYIRTFSPADRFLQQWSTKQDENGRIHWFNHPFPCYFFAFLQNWKTQITPLFNLFNPKTASKKCEDYLENNQQEYFICPAEISNISTKERRNEWTSEWMGGWMIKRMDGWIDEWIGDWVSEWINK